MHLELDETGNPISTFVNALRGRQIDLVGDGSSSHPMQVLGPHSRSVAQGVERVLDCIDDLPISHKAGGVAQSKELREAFRRLIYDSTELLDLYAQLLPDRLAKSSRKAKSDITSYRNAAKRLRDPWALMCNKFKHSGSQLAYARASSKHRLAVSHGFIFLTPRHGDAMLRDEQVHKPPERRATFERKLHELVHAILRTDYNAAKLIRALPDGEGQQLELMDFSFPLSSSLQRLAARRIFVGGEPTTFDGVELPGDETVALIKRSGIPLIEGYNGTTEFEGDGQSRTFTFG